MSDLLYHVKRTIIRYDEDPSGATRDVDILGTFTDLAAAKAAANAGLAVSLDSTCPTLFPLTTPSYISVHIRFKDYGELLIPHLYQFAVRFFPL